MLCFYSLTGDGFRLYSSSNSCPGPELRERFVQGIWGRHPSSNYGIWVESALRRHFCYQQQHTAPLKLQLRRDQQEVEVAQT